MIRKLLGFICILLYVSGLALLLCNILIRNDNSNLYLTISLGSICTASVLNLIRTSLEKEPLRN